MKPAILLATLAFAGAASAADPVVVDKPRVAVGDTWTYNSEIRAANRSRKLVETFEVSGVTGNRLHVVVLRKFEGEAEGTVQVAKKPKPGRTMVTVWWVPELRRWVKLEQDFGPNGHSQELVSYKLAP